MVSTLAYKVLRLRVNELVSMHALGNALTRYVPNEITYPPFGKLFVFDSLFHACNYACDYEYAEVWECEVTNPSPIIGRAPSSQDWSFEEFWRGEYSGIIFEPPNGTLGVESVKLIRKV